MARRELQLHDVSGRTLLSGSSAQMTNSQMPKATAPAVAHTRRIPGDIGENHLASELQAASVTAIPMSATPAWLNPQAGCPAKHPASFPAQSHGATTPINVAISPQQTHAKRVHRAVWFQSITFSQGDVMMHLGDRHRSGRCHGR